MEQRDIPAIRAIYEAAGYAFPFPRFDSPLIEAVEVIVDESDTPVMAAAAKRSIELYLFCAPGGSHPLVKLEAIRLLHESMRDKVVGKGYLEATAFLPPEISENYGRHLMRKFGWLRTWPAFAIRDWKGK